MVGNIVKKQNKALHNIGISSNFASGALMSLHGWLLDTGDNRTWDDCAIIQTHRCTRSLFIQSRTSSPATKRSSLWYPLHQLKYSPVASPPTGLNIAPPSSRRIVFQSLSSNVELPKTFTRHAANRAALRRQLLLWLRQYINNYS